MQIEHVYKHKKPVNFIKHLNCVFNTFIYKVELVYSGDIKW